MRSRISAALLAALTAVALTACIPFASSTTSKYSRDDVQLAVHKYYRALTWWVHDPDRGIVALQDASTVDWTATVVVKAPTLSADPSAIYRFGGDVREAVVRDNAIEALTCATVTKTFDSGELEITALDRSELVSITLVRDLGGLAVAKIEDGLGPCP